jgi:SM-20-related protein
MTEESRDHAAEDGDDPGVAAVADRVAAEGWAVQEGFLSPAETEALAADCRELWEDGEFRRAGVGHGADLRVRPEVRSDYVHWVTGEEASSELARYLGRVEALRRTLNRRLYLGLFDFEAHLTVYPPGAFYAKHLDRFRSVSYRTVSVLLYLNRDWRADDGGALRIYLDAEGAEDGPTVDVAPRGGTLVAFLSGRFHHEVLPARRERMSVTGWLKVRT